MRRTNRDSETLPFHVVSANALVAGALTISVVPGALSPRAGVVADTWSHYRLKSLKFRLHPTAASGNSCSAGFVGGVQDTAPATFAQIGELLPSVILAGDTTVPTEWCKVSKQDLAGPLPWYKSVLGAADATEEQPGILCFAGTTTEVFLLEARGVYEFKTAVNSANTPQELALQAQFREARAARIREVERTKLLMVLSPKPSQSMPPVVVLPSPPGL